LIHYSQGIICKENALIKRGFVERFETYFLNNTEIKLTEKSTDFLEKENIKLVNKKGDDSKCHILPEKLAKKKLFFNEIEKKQLDLISNSLKGQKFVELQKRLESKALPTGVAVLLHGAPGTGKTESVYQIAKATGRGIIKVDISQTKSMWFGESEKIIKKVFTDYEEIRKKSKKCPILFFNEADAVISRRKDTASSNVAQTENAIQNILLEELENFKGILFATTNLADNLDKAFERRFLFKVDFSFPDEIVRANIWKSKLKGFSSSNYSVLANEFSFSGGQIDNIVRKAELFEVVEGRKAHIAEIRNWCGEELINKKNNIKIGF
ncbi:MAG: AAA family ATPase, partial [Bacteroidetes bacterium]|nr:AAA family ATPase [Bacteroidota bacterium]